MSSYNSTREGFQKAMEWSLTGPPEETIKYVEATATPSFYRVFNGNRIEYDGHVKDTAEWRAISLKYYPVVDQFLRDGDLLAAHMTGTIELDGVSTFFESFMFAEVDKESGKLKWMNERSVWGPAGKAPVHGTQ